MDIIYSLNQLSDINPFSYDAIPYTGVCTSVCGTYIQVNNST